MKGKRGLLKFIIGVIVGILCVIPLLSLGSQLISMFFSPPKEIQQAQGTLDEIYNSVNPLYIDESTTPPFLLLVPQNWWLIGFDKEGTTYVQGIEAKPGKDCDKKICICICQNADCTKSSVCKGFPKPFKILSENMAIQIKRTEVNITNKEKVYEAEVIEEQNA